MDLKLLRLALKVAPEATFRVAIHFIGMELLYVLGKAGFVTRLYRESYIVLGNQAIVIFGAARALFMTVR